MRYTKQQVLVKPDMHCTEEYRSDTINGPCPLNTIKLRREKIQRITRINSKPALGKGAQQKGAWPETSLHLRPEPGLQREVMQKQKGVRARRNEPANTEQAQRTGRKTQQLQASSRQGGCPDDKKKEPFRRYWE